VNEFSILDAAAAGMDVQRGLLDLAARNVAAAQVAGTDGAFERLVPRFVATVPAAEGPADPFGAGEEGPFLRLGGAGRQPGSEADALTEMVAVLDAQRAYEANASVFDAGKRLAERTIDLGRL
jgi:flagellar basal body rod protein FlgC